MALEQQIQADVKSALKGGQKFIVGTLRNVLSQIKDERIKLRPKREITEEDVLSVLLTAVKRRKESIQMYKQGNRPDLVEKEQNEVEILEKYLPAQLSEAEIIEIINDTIKSTGATSIRDMGKVMGPSMGRLKGQADGKVVQNLVRERLQQLTQ